MQRGFRRIGRTFEIAETDCLGIGGGDLAQHARRIARPLSRDARHKDRASEWSDGAVLDLFHDEERPLQRFAVELQRNRLRHGQARACGTPDRRGIRWCVRFRSGWRADRGAGSARASWPRVARAKAIGLAARAARDARKIAHTQDRARRVCPRDRSASRRERSSLMAPDRRCLLKPDGACASDDELLQHAAAVALAIRGPYSLASRTPAHAGSADRFRSTLAVSYSS